MSGLVRYSIPRLYYLVTPAFILLDYCGGISVRVAVLDNMPVYKNLYYAFCVLCGVAVYLLPQWSAVVALFESPVNLVITILGLVLPYVETIKKSDDILTTGWSPTLGLSTEYVTNLLLAAGIATFAFLQANKALSDRFDAAARSDAVVKRHSANSVYEIERNSTVRSEPDRKDRKKPGE